MSKAGVSNAPVKQENSPYKKDNRGHNNSNDKRSSGNFNKSDRQSHPNRDRDRADHSNSSNRNDDHHHEFDEKEKDAGAGEKKFTGRCRLFVGNLTPDISEADFRKMFETYGEISEVYVNTQRGFGFIRLDYRQNAEAAKAALDGMQRKGRILRVRFATHGAALKVKNLHSHVSNELLEQSFSQFGELERCIVIVDDRGKSTGEGIVEFVRKPGANSALRRITEGVFLMGIDPKPVSVEPLEQKDEEDGMPEKFLTKTDQYKKEREKEPRFAPPGTFEYEFGMRWKQLDELEKQRIEQVKKDTEKARIELEDEMQNALYDYQAEQIRQDLMRQQEELRRLEQLRDSERLRKQQEMEIRRQKEEREMAQQDERRREMMMNMSRQQEMARGRSGPMDGPGMRSREEMMMADRFGDRMSDRMPERMGDRMRQGGPGGPGFNMWQDEKQRNEAEMKGMRGNEPPNRGRDMRGPPGNQQMQQSGQGGPQSGMDRGPPPPAAGSGPSGPGPNNGGQKDGPKPLMQQGGGFNVGGQGNNGPPNNQNAGGADGNNMGSACDEVKDDLGDCLAVEAQLDPDSTQTIAERCALDKPLRCSPSPTSENVTVDMPKPPWKDQSDNQCNSEMQSPQNEGSASWEQESPCAKDSLSHDIVQEEMDVSCMCPKANGDSNDISIERKCNCGNQLSLINSSDRIEILDSHPDNDMSTVRSNSSASDLSNHESACDDEKTCEIVEESDSHRGAVGEYCVPTLDNQRTAQSSESTFCKPYTIRNEIKSYSKPSTPPNDIVECLDSSPADSHSMDVLLLSSNLSQTHQSSPSHTITSTTSSCGSLANYQTSCASETNGSFSCCDNHHSLPSPSCKSNQCADVGTREYHTLFCPPVNDGDCVEKDICSHLVNKELIIETDSSKVENCDPSKSGYSFSSYRQNLSGNFEEMDTEVLEECDSELRTTDPNIYQSYKSNTAGQYIPMAGVEEGENSQWQNVASEQSQSLNTSRAIVIYQGDTTDLSSNQASASDVIPACDFPTSSTSDTHGSSMEGSSNDEAFRTGDQTFKTEASREAALASITHTAESPSSPLTSVSSVPVSGVKQSSMMSSSTMHISQLPGSATIMQHQTMRSGPTGGLAQATVLQKQALPNGGQAMVQQRTITNGGQTMLVQQHTMTNGLGGITQQTVVQQRVIPNVAQQRVIPNVAQQRVIPNVAQQRVIPNVAHAQAAALHATALRQHAIATQQAAQASVLQQQGIRLARAVGSSVYQNQSLGRRTMLHGSGSAVLGPRLVQAPTAQGSMMQQLVRQRYLGGPVLHPVRGVHMLAGRPIRVKMAYGNEHGPTR